MCLVTFLIVVAGHLQEATYEEGIIWLHYKSLHLLMARKVCSVRGRWVQVAGHICSQEQGMMELELSSLSPFPAAQGMVLPTFRMGLPNSVDLI